MVEICILLSKENLSLSKAEVQSVLETQKTQFDLNLLKLELNTNISKLVRNLDKTAYSKKSFEIIISAKSYELLEKQLAKKDLKLKSSKTFAIRTLNLTEEKSNFDVINVSKSIYSDSIGEVDLKNPEQEFYIILAKNAYFCRLIWSNTNKFDERKADKRPSPHPTSMNPKLARALINLANPKKELLDPFCGSGGIMLEAGVLGLKTIGIDIDNAMINRAKINLEHYGVQNFILLEQDALTWEKPIECIVTDVPYGKSSKLKEELSELIKRFLDKYKDLTKKIVLVYPDRISLDKMLISNEFTISKEFSIYIHSNLTRKIVLLEKSSNKGMK